MANETPTLEPKLPPVQWEKHQADMERRRAEHEAKHPELLRCLNPAYAAKREMEKPHYRWTVKAKWMGPDNGTVVNMESEQVVIAQSEADAWAAFCDKIGRWPSRRDAKPIIKRGKPVGVESLVGSGFSHNEADEEIPTIKVGPKPKKYGL